jgi:peptide/nickel transport system permease protein
MSQAVRTRRIPGPLPLAALALLVVGVLGLMLPLDATERWTADHTWVMGLLIIAGTAGLGISLARTRPDDWPAGRLGGRGAMIAGAALLMGIVLGQSSFTWMRAALALVALCAAVAVFAAARVLRFIVPLVVIAVVLLAVWVIGSAAVSHTALQTVAGRTTTTLLLVMTVAGIAGTGLILLVSGAAVGRRRALALLVFSAVALVLGLLLPHSISGRLGEGLLIAEPWFVAGGLLTLAAVGDLPWMYIARRLALGLLTVALISFVVFSLSYAIPGKPYSAQLVNPRLTKADKQRIIERYDADKPFIVQYSLFARRVLGFHSCDHDRATAPSPDRVPKECTSGNTGWYWSGPHPDLGDSIPQHASVATAIARRAPNTFLLMGVSYIFQLLVAIPIGVISAVKQYSKLDNTVTSLAFVGISLPNYWFGLLLIIVFAFPHGTLGPFLPSGGLGDGELYDHLGAIDWSTVGNWTSHLILPSIVLAVQGIANYARFMRSSMLETLSQDYVRTAWAKGLGGRAVIMRHSFRNSLLPLITLIGLDLPQLFVGAVITENIFNWYGMGRLFVDASFQNDDKVLLGITLLLSALVVIGNLVADVAYTFADPRISYKRAAA